MRLDSETPQCQACKQPLKFVADKIFDKGWRRNKKVSHLSKRWLAGVTELHCVTVKVVGL